MTDETTQTFTIHDLIALYEAAPADWKGLVFVTDATASASNKESSLGTVNVLPTDDLEGRIVRLYGAPLDVFLRLKRPNGQWSKVARLFVDARAAHAYAQPEPPRAAPAPAQSPREAALERELAELRSQVTQANEPKEAAVVPSSPFEGSLRVLDVASALATKMLQGPGATPPQGAITAQDAYELGKKAAAKDGAKSGWLIALETLGPGLIDVAKEISGAVRDGVRANIAERQQQLQQPASEPTEPVTAQVDEDPAKGNAA